MVTHRPRQVNNLEGKRTSARWNDKLKLKHHQVGDAWQGFGIKVSYQLVIIQELEVKEKNVGIGTFE